MTEYWEWFIAIFGPGVVAAIILLVACIRFIRKDRREQDEQPDYIPGNSQTAIELNCEASTYRSRARRHG